MVLNKLSDFSEVGGRGALIIFLGTKILKWLVIKTKIKPIIEPIIEGNSNPKRERYTRCVIEIGLSSEKTAKDERQTFKKW